MALERIEPGLVISLGVVDVATAKPESVDALLPSLHQPTNHVMLLM